MMEGGLRIYHKTYYHPNRRIGNQAAAITLPLVIRVRVET